MSIYSCPNNVKNIITILILLWLAPFLFAQETNLTSMGNRGYIGNRSTKQEEKNLTELQKQARQYRAQGLEFQHIGNIDEAMALYQKAIELDPSYAVAYNDLGILYEQKGFIERAQESYLKAIKIDPNYLSPYTNLALVYENKRDLENSAFYWEKRVELGSPDDPWTQKAKQRLEDTRLVLSKRPLQELREQEVVEFLKDVETQKAAFKKDNKTLANDFFQKAKIKFKKGDEVTALKIAVDAQQLDPSNTDIQEFVDKIQTRLLSR